MLKDLGLWDIEHHGLNILYEQPPDDLGDLTYLQLLDLKVSNHITLMGRPNPPQRLIVMIGSRVLEALILESHELMPELTTMTFLKERYPEIYFVFSRNLDPWAMNVEMTDDILGAW